MSRLEYFDFLLRHAAEVNLKRGGSEYVLRVPEPSAFVCHKCATFTDRIDRQKMAKDLYYAYFVLRYAPDPDKIAAEIRGIRRNLYTRKRWRICGSILPERPAAAAQWRRRKTGRIIILTI